MTRATKAGDVSDHAFCFGAVALGQIGTPFNPSDRLSKDIEKSGAHTEMKRPVRPEEIAPAYVVLAAAQCSCGITGEILSIIGGYSGG